MYEIIQNALAELKLNNLHICDQFYANLHNYSPLVEVDNLRDWRFPHIPDSTIFSAFSPNNESFRKTIIWNLNNKGFFWVVAKESRRTLLFIRSKENGCISVITKHQLRIVANHSGHLAAQLAALLKGRRFECFRKRIK